MVRIVLLFILVCAGVKTLSQNLILQNNATRYRWQQINTPNFRLIYQPDFEEEALRLATKLDQIYLPVANSMGVKPRKIPIILQNRTAFANGFVTLGPRRSEFYTMPPQDYNFLGSNDWLELLAIHEYRHVVQFQRSLTGFNKLFYYLFGQQTQAGFAFAAAPLWFWEGDAVAVETAFTPSGRGRIPNFDLMLRTNFLEDRTFNYHKAYLRSYKHFIPNHYVLGYHMVSYVRNESGDNNIWGKISKDAFDVPFKPFTFSKAMKRHTGQNVRETYKSMVSDLKEKWQSQVDELELTEFETINQRKNNAFTNYNYPQPIYDGRVLALKDGIGDIETLVSIKDGKEKKIFVPGIVNNAGMLSYNAGKLIWAEYNFDPRWRMQTYSVIRMFDVIDNQYEKITFKTRFAAPAISADGQQIIAIENNERYETKLVLLSKTGEILKIFPNPDNSFYAMPRWANEGNEVVILKSNKAGKTIVLLNTQSGEERELLPYSHENVGHPIKFGNYVFYNSPYSGIDNIYAFDVNTGSRYQVTSSKYAAYNPAVDRQGEYIYYNEQSRDGLDIVRIPFDPSSWKPLEAIKVNEVKYYEQTVEQELGSVGTFGFRPPTTTYTPARYNRASGIINPHSWGYYFTNDINEVNVGIFSQDILSTTNIRAGYLYDVVEQAGIWNLGLSYQGLYPIIDLNLSTGSRTGNSSLQGESYNIDWQERSAEIGLRLPLQLTRSKYIKGLEISNYFGASKVIGLTSNKLDDEGTLIDQYPGRFGIVFDTLAFVFKNFQGNGVLRYNTFRLSYNNNLRQNYRDFLSPWSQSILFEHQSTPFGGNFDGGLWAIRGSLSFPGLFKHHVAYVRAASQYRQQGRETNIYLFRNRIPRPRGHAYPQDETFNTISVNYAFPIWYPDVNVGALLNVQRIKTNLFFDYGQGAGRNYFYKVDDDNRIERIYFSLADATYQSFGAETTFDINLGRLLPQFEVGVRTTYRLNNAFNNQGLVVELLMGNIRL